MIKSRITSKAQTTIPKPVRDLLGLSEGDTLVYDIVDGRVELRREASTHGDDPFATFSEWASDFDREDYADL